MTSRPCPDCAAPVGFEHDDGCDVARCLYTGGQRISCDEWADEDVELFDETHDCGRDVWTGEWPGKADCRRLGLWCRDGDRSRGEPSFVPCAPDDEGAMPDLNRLREGAFRWDPITCWWERWERAGTSSGDR